MVSPCNRREAKPARRAGRPRTSEIGAIQADRRSKLGPRHRTPAKDASCRPKLPREPTPTAASRAARNLLHSRHQDPGPEVLRAGPETRRPLSGPGLGLYGVGEPSEAAPDSLHSGE